MISGTRAFFPEKLSDLVDTLRRYHARLHEVLFRAQGFRPRFPRIRALIGERYLERPPAELLVLDCLQKVEPVAHRHCDIEKNDIGRETTLEERECFVDRKAGVYCVAFVGEFHRVHIEQELIVVEQEHCRASAFRILGALIFRVRVFGHTIIASAFPRSSRAPLSRSSPLSLPHPRLLLRRGGSRAWRLPSTG